MKHVVLCSLVLAISTPARAQLGARDRAPLELPSRPFLLVDAPRRFLPDEPARVRVQLREGGRVAVALFSLTSPAELLGHAGSRQGISLATTPIGHEAEQLVSAHGALPRTGRRLTLRASTNVEMPRPEGARRIDREAVVYDSNENIEDGVATYWVADERWSVREVDLGRLPVGLYLVQVRGGPWVTSALLSVGELVLLARRGDRHDVVRVTDRNGAPREVAVSAYDGARLLHRGRSDANGIVRFASAHAANVRFVAAAGADLAWTDVSHVRLARCDPRVYLATGRPLYRRNERVHVRGHVRGCNESGAYVGLASRTVRVNGGGRSVEATSDADGNFVAEVQADGELSAELHGQVHSRRLIIDDRELPQRDVIVTPDRPWATAGETIAVRVADVDGGWPSPVDVVLDTPVGRQMARMGPNLPAVFHVQVPSTNEALERMQLHASVSESGRVTMGSAELFIGRTPVHLDLRAERDRGERDRPFSVRVSAQELSGNASPGPVDLALFGSDGNEIVGDARRRMRVDVAAVGHVGIEVPLNGEGPWMLIATRGAARARMVVWERERPPSLSERGPLGLVPTSTRARVGDELGVDVRLPAGSGRGWLTLEQGGVVRALAIDGSVRRTRVALSIPDEARGLASLVLSYVESGRVQTATATVEVETSQPMSLALETDRTIYGRAERAQVSIVARTDEGRPHDAVISLWMADAGYWGLGEDDYPLPDAYLRLPGRSATGADSTTPIAYGAEEGRVFDSKLEWNGRRVSGSSHRHAWGFGGEVIHRLSVHGSLRAVLDALARAAGLERSEIVECAEGNHRLLVHDLPWDLVAVRVGEQLSADVSVEGDVLHFACGAGAGHGGFGMGRGAAVPRIRTGSADVRGLRAERLEGTLHFVGLARLGDDGRLDLEVPLPDHPGRWRIEVLAIADDGGGARAHSIVHTRQPLEAWLNVPRSARPSDLVRGEIVITGHALAGQEVELSTVVDGGRLLAPLPARVRFDASGRANVPLAITDMDVGEVQIRTSARCGSAQDSISSSVLVHPPWSHHSFSQATLMGPSATEIDVALPDLARPAMLEVALPSSIENDAARVLDQLREARWDIAALRVDRLASLGALRRALRGVVRVEAQLVRDEIDRAVDSELHALREMRRSDRLIDGPWSAEYMTLETLRALDECTRGRETGPSPVCASNVDDRSTWQESVEAIRDRVEDGRLGGPELAMALALLPDRTARTNERLERALRESAGDLEGLAWTARAARRLGMRSVQREATLALARTLDRSLATMPPAGSCRGPAIFFCFNRHGDHGRLARAALALIELEHGGARRIGARVAAFLGERPMHSTFAWGTAEADAIELIALLDAPAGRDPYEVFVDGRVVRHRNGRIAIPAGRHRLSLRFAERSGRLRRVIVRGEISAAQPSSAIGNVILERRFVAQADGWEAQVRFDLRDASDEVVVRVPLPAGLTLDQRRLGPEFRMLADGAAHFALTNVARGHHELRVPLLSSGSGRFEAGSTQLTSADGRFFGMTPAARVELR